MATNEKQNFTNSRLRKTEQTKEKHNQKGSTTTRKEMIENINFALVAQLVLCYFIACLLLSFLIVC